MPQTCFKQCFVCVFVRMQYYCSHCVGAAPLQFVPVIAFMLFQAGICRMQLVLRGVAVVLGAYVCV